MQESNGDKGRKKIKGRPKRKFKDYLEEDLKIKKLKVTDAESRHVLRRKIRTGDMINWEKPLEEVLLLV